MPISPEGGLSMLEQKRGEPFICVDMDKASQEDYKKLEKLGWTMGRGSMSGELTFFWKGEGEPVLPDELAEKVIGKKSGKIDYTSPINKETE